MSRTRERLHRLVLDLLAGAGRPRQVIDVGCGDAELPARLRDAGHSVRCCDLASHADVPGVVHRCGDVREALPFEDGADAVVCCEVVEHLLDPARSFRNLAARVRPGGVLVLTLPNYWNVTHRLRYLLTGGLQRCKCGVARDDAPYLPHVSAWPLESYAFLARREGLSLERVQGENVPWAHLLPYAPLVLVLWLLSLARRRAGDHREANGFLVLAGRHVALVFRRFQAPLGVP